MQKSKLQISVPVSVFLHFAFFNLHFAFCIESGSETSTLGIVCIGRVYRDG